MVDPHSTATWPAGAPEHDKSDVLDQLRNATAGRHAAIEDLLDLHRPFGRAHYGRVLQGFAAFLAQWEPRMAAVLPPRLQPLFAEGRRLHLLQQDLAALHVAAAPTGDDAPDLSTLPHALGSLYVMEGSALGGQYIAAHLRRHLDLTPEHGSAYFHGAGRGTAGRWREVRALLASELQDAADAATAVRSAQHTFDALMRTFQELPRERAAA